MKSDQKEIKKAAAGVSKEIYKQSGKEYKELLEKTAKSAAIPKTLLGLSDEMVEGIYSQAYRLYNTGRYEDAAELFRMLVMINATEAKYILGLAACYHMLKDYNGAVETYAICATLDPESPIPFYHSSDCYIQMNDPLSATIALEMAVKRAGDNPEFQVLKERAQLTIESLQKEQKSGKEAKKKKK